MSGYRIVILRNAYLTMLIFVLTNDLGLLYIYNGKAYNSWAQMSSDFP